MKGDEGIKTGKEITKLIYLGIVRDSNYRFPESLGVEVPNGSVAACNASRQESVPSIVLRKFSQPSA